MSDIFSKLKEVGTTIVDKSSKVASNIDVSELGDKIKNSIPSKIDESKTDEEKEELKAKKVAAKSEKEEMDLANQLMKLPSEKVERILNLVNEETKHVIAMGPVVQALKDTYVLQRVSFENGLGVYKVKRKKGSLFAYLFVADEMTDEVKTAIEEMIEKNKDMQEVEHIAIALKELQYVTDFMDCIVLAKDLEKGKEAYAETVEIEERSFTLTFKKDIVIEQLEPEVEQESANAPEKTETETDAADDNTTEE